MREEEQISGLERRPGASSRYLSGCARRAPKGRNTDAIIRNVPCEQAFIFVYCRGEKRASIISMRP